MMQVLIQNLNPKILPTSMAVLLKLAEVTCGYKKEICEVCEWMPTPQPQLHAHPGSEMPTASCRKFSLIPFSAV